MRECRSCDALAPCPQVCRSEKSFAQVLFISPIFLLKEEEFKVQEHLPSFP